METTGFFHFLFDTVFSLVDRLAADASDAVGCNQIIHTCSFQAAQKNIILFSETACVPVEE
jgi:hypothetical protein